MKPEQRPKYFAEWNLARKVLIQSGFSPKEANAERYRIHEECGLPESSKDFNKTTHLDKFIIACRKIRGVSSIDIQDQERQRLVKTIESFGLSDDYHDHLVRCKKDGTDWKALPVAKLLHLLYTAKKRSAALAAKTE